MAKPEKMQYTIDEYQIEVKIPRFGEATLMGGDNGGIALVDSGNSVMPRAAAEIFASKEPDIVRAECGDRVYKKSFPNHVKQAALHMQERVRKNYGL